MKKRQRKSMRQKAAPSDNPLIIHITNMKDLERIVTEIPETAKKVAESYWPGPLTMIFEKAEIVPYGTTGGLKTVAVRMPDHPAARAVIDAGGGYIAAPSANTSGRPSPTCAEHVAEDLSGRIEMIVDAGAGGYRRRIHHSGYDCGSAHDPAAGSSDQGNAWKS